MTAKPTWMRTPASTKLHRGAASDLKVTLEEEETNPTTSEKEVINSEGTKENWSAEIAAGSRSIGEFGRSTLIMTQRRVGEKCQQK